MDSKREVFLWLISAIQSAWPQRLRIPEERTFGVWLGSLGVPAIGLARGLAPRVAERPDALLAREGKTEPLERRAGK